MHTELLKSTKVGVSIGKNHGISVQIRQQVSSPKAWKHREHRHWGHCQRERYWELCRQWGHSRHWVTDNTNMLGTLQAVGAQHNTVERIVSVQGRRRLLEWCQSDKGVPWMIEKCQMQNVMSRDLSKVLLHCPIYLQQLLHRMQKSYSHHL